MVGVASNLYRLAQRSLVVLAVILLFLYSTILVPARVSAAACTSPATDYGLITATVDISAPGTYRIWSRLAAPSSGNNTYLLEVDGSTCFTVGGSGVPVYPDGATNYFSSDNSNWIYKTSSGTNVETFLSAGVHSLKMIGTGDGLVLDRLVFTTDMACVPTGTGNNCINTNDITPPSVSITSPANGAIVTIPISVNVNASDSESGVSSAGIWLDNPAGSGAAQQTLSASPFMFSLGGLTFGSHTLLVKATNSAGLTGITAATALRITEKSDVTRNCQINFSDISAVIGKLGTTGFQGPADVNGDSRVNFSDISAVIGKLGTTPC